mmetsp:Transcript_13709/g.34736  ORF Transcript_13709/g.34736 Transcript_13709/m.34736 type:complete len:205 (+) Transcript_13709:956-1570(+)
MASISRSYQSLIVCVNPVKQGPEMNMAPTSKAKLFGSQVQLPLAAAPQIQPRTSGGQVTGLHNCKRIFHSGTSSSLAPFMPSSCLAPPSPSAALVTRAPRRRPVAAAAAAAQAKAAQAARLGLAAERCEGLSGDPMRPTVCCLSPAMARGCPSVAQAIEAESWSERETTKAATASNASSPGDKAERGRPPEASTQRVMAACSGS